MSHTSFPSLIGIKYLTMTKTTVIKFACTITMLFMITFSYAQPGPPVDAPDETNSFLIWFDNSWTAQDIIDFRDEFNSYEHWQSPLTGTRYWQVYGFPFNLNDGTLIININQSGGQANDRIGSNGGAGLNVVVYEINAQGPPPSNPPGTNQDPQMDCLGAHSPYAVGGPGQQVNLGVFDTGIIDPIASITGYHWNFNNMAQYDYINDQQTAFDFNGHGTAMATIASHVANKRNVETNGVPANVTFNKIAKTIGPNGSGLLAEMLYGFEESVMQGTQVANCSWGFTTDYLTAMKHPFARSIEFAKNQYGTLVVAAAGNFGMDFSQHAMDLNFPACYPFDNVLSVTSYGCNGQFASFANYGGGHVDVAAPGYLIAHHSVLGQIRYDSGTSHSTAIVSGLASAIGTHLQASTLFDYAKVKCAIMNGSTFASTAVNNGLVAFGGIVHGEGALYALEHSCGFIPPSGGGGPRGRSIDTGSKIYPNPSQGIVNLSIDSEIKEQVEIKIYDSFGQYIYGTSIQVEKGDNEIQLEPVLTSGQYHINVFTDNTIQKHKLMVIK